jgi:hypothetical protein
MISFLASCAMLAAFLFDADRSMCNAQSLAASSVRTGDLIAQLMLLIKRMPRAQASALRPHSV